MRGLCKVWVVINYRVSTSTYVRVCDCGGISYRLLSSTPFRFLSLPLTPFLSLTHSPPSLSLPPFHSHFLPHSIPPSLPLHPSLPPVDVVFFDESIDAKLNRYMFKFRNIDTPFLLDNANLHAKTYVPPTANTVGLVDYGKDGRVYEYERFPALE
jgi:hypothetical protein